jgi:hypothetical protein
MMEAACSSETLATLCPGITPQKTIVTIITAVRTPNLASVFVKTCVGVSCIETPVALAYAIHLALVPEKLLHEHGAQLASR